MILRAFIPALLLIAAPARADIVAGKQFFLNGEYVEAQAELVQVGDAEAYYLLGLMRDPHFHTLPYYFGTKTRVPVYDGGLELDNKTMTDWYRRAYEEGHVGARFRYCQWSMGPHADDRLHLKNSRCKRLYTDLRKLAAESDDPMLAYYAYVAGSGEIGSKQRHKRADDLLRSAAMTKDREAQFYLGKVLLQYNPRYDRPSDFVQAFGWFSVAASQQNFHARVYQVFTAERLETEEQKQEAAKLARQLIAAHGAAPAENPRAADEAAEPE